MMRRRPPKPKQTISAARREYDVANLICAGIWLLRAAELGEEAAVIRVSRATVERIEKEKREREPR